MRLIRHLALSFFLLCALVSPVQAQARASTTTGVVTIREIISGQLIFAPGTSTNGPLVVSQPAETDIVPIVSAQHFTSGVAPFEELITSIQYTNQGTYYDQYGVMGFNANAYVTAGGGVTSQPSLVMAFENNFYNSQLGKFTYEWYINYQSQDHTTVTNFRPIYMAIARGSNSDHSALVAWDVGDANGVFDLLAHGVTSDTLVRFTSANIQFGTVAGESSTYGVCVNCAGATPAGVGASLVVKPSATNSTGIIVRGLASQSNDLAQWQDSNGNAIFKISAAGVPGVRSGGSTTISTGTGTVKMSTTSSANNAAWIPFSYAGTTYFIPAWATNAP